MNKKSYLKIISFLLFTIAFQTNLISQNNIKGKIKLRKPIFVNDSEDPVQSTINVGNITCWVSENGFHDWIVNSWNGSYPNGAKTGVIFSEGIVWGGLVHDGNDTIVRVNGNTYKSGCKAITRLFRVRPDYKTAGLIRDAASFFLKPIENVTDTDIQQLREQYQKDWNEWPTNEGAIFDDVDSNGIYNPTFDIPGVPGASQTIFIKYDDSKSVSNYESPPIGLEVTETYWGYSFNGALGNVIFKKVNLVYKGTSKSISNSHIDSMYINQWSDPDIGISNDDFAGCDTSLNLGYAYNATVDNIYDGIPLPPKAVGYDIVQGVSKYTGNQSDSAMFNLKWRKEYKYVNRKPMSTFIRHGTGGTYSGPSYNYNGTLQYFNLMRGKLPLPEYPRGEEFPSSLAVVTEHSTYFLPGDPVTGTGLIDGFVDGPGDRRLWSMTGPFTMNLNDTVETVIALVGGMGSDNLNSITKMKENDVAAQKAFDRLFKLPSILPPDVEVIPLHKKIILNWGSNLDFISAVESFSVDDYNFEGYEIYQLPSKIADIEEGVKIGSFDLVNGVTAIYDTVRDVNWVNIPKLQASGKDNGISRYIEITKNSLKKTDLFDGTTYYFAVVSYAHNKSPIFPYHLIRSPIKIIEAVPQTAAPGIRYNSTFGGTLVSLHTGKSEGRLLPIVVDPTKTNGKTYQITFDTLNNDIVWNMKEKFTGEIILTNQSNQLGYNDYPIVNGIMPKVISQPKGIKEWSYNGSRWVSGFDWGGSQFLGGMDIGENFWQEALPMYNYVPIELRFTGGAGREIPSEENGWTQGAVYRKDKNYAYAGIGWMPFTAWDISDSVNPRQVNVSFVEDSIQGNTNFKWDLGGDESHFAANGGNEYIIVSNTFYEASFYNENNNAIKKDNMYFIWPKPRGSRPYLEGQFTMKVVPNRINLPEDIYEFTAPLVTKDINLMKTDIDNINVFPNPYYTYGSSGDIDNTGYVTFNHLPNNAIIRIFDLSGVLLKTINHEQTSGPFARWDLQNNNGKKVASGIYIVYINMPELNKTKIIKLAIVK